MASARARKEALDLLRRYPNMHEHLADIPAVREIKHEQAGAWVKSLGLNPARHSLPGKAHSAPAAITRRMYEEAASLVWRAVPRKGK